MNTCKPVASRVLQVDPDTLHENIRVWHSVFKRCLQDKTLRAMTLVGNKIMRRIHSPALGEGMFGASMSGHLTLFFQS
jgi:hypothetical protein